MDRRILNWLEYGSLAVAVCAFFPIMSGARPIVDWVIPVLFAALLSYILYRDARVEVQTDLSEKIPRYTPVLNAAFFFYFFLLHAIAAGFSGSFGSADPWSELTSFLTDLLITVSLYYLLLMLALPLLRKLFNARTCASLWLLPVLLSVFFNHSFQFSFLHHRPVLVLDLPEQIYRPLLAVWLAGAVLVMGWHLFSHLRFRRFLLASATPVEDTETLELWQEVCQKAHMRKIPLLSRSANTKTPLSIGLFSPHVVLPDKHYAPDALELILRHELIHIMRQDSQNKFFLVFLKALGWFNPLMWIAMRKSADDLELSCDETVLLDADPQQRRQYAGLLLHTAGDQRGFTTCLSASATALRYRMRAVTVPSRRLVGGLLAGVLVLLLFTASGYTAFSIRTGTGEELLFPDGVEQYRVETVMDCRFSKPYPQPDSQAILDYLGHLPLRQINRGYDFEPKAYSYEEGSEQLRFSIRQGDETWDITLSSLGLYVSQGRNQRSFLMDSNIDWAYLESLLGPQDQP